MLIPGDGDGINNNVRFPIGPVIVALAIFVGECNDIVHLSSHFPDGRWWCCSLAVGWRTRSQSLTTTPTVVAFLVFDWPVCGDLAILVVGIIDYANMKCRRVLI